MLEKRIKSFMFSGGGIAFKCGKIRRNKQFFITEGGD
jgi:hypothetical protein